MLLLAMNEALGKSNLSLGWELLIERELAFQIKLVGYILWTGNTFWECQAFSLKRGPLQWPRECCGAASPGAGASIILARLALGRLLLFSAGFAVLLRMVRLLNCWGLKQVARLFLHCRGWFQLSTVADLDPNSLIFILLCGLSAGEASYTWTVPPWEAIL